MTRTEELKAWIEDAIQRVDESEHGFISDDLDEIVEEASQRDGWTASEVALEALSLVGNEWVGTVGVAVTLEETDTVTCRAPAFSEARYVPGQPLGLYLFADQFRGNWPIDGDMYGESLPMSPDSDPRLRVEFVSRRFLEGRQWDEFTNTFWYYASNRWG